MVASTDSELERAREHFVASEWAAAHDAFCCADEQESLGPDDLESFATTAFLLGDEIAFCRITERAHHDYLEADNLVSAARCAFWIGMTLVFRKQVGPATGWFGRAARILTKLNVETAQHGYLLLPMVHRHVGEGDFAGALEAARQATTLGEKHSDADLTALGRHLEGRIQVNLGNAQAGLELMDESMVAVTAGELSPRVSGIIYCNVIEGCREVFAFARARQWTDALSAWCAHQPSMVAFTGKCLVHRAQLLRMQGKWTSAFKEAQRASERLSRDGASRSEAIAVYEQAEVYRLRGDYEAAHRAYQQVRSLGTEPVPGCALLHLACGKESEAVTEIRRALDATTDPMRRTLLLDACVEILLAKGDVSGARTASTELSDIAGRFNTEVLTTIAFHCQGAVFVGNEDPEAALMALKKAADGWRSVGAPYELARVRVLLAEAYQQLGDGNAVEIELAAANAVFEELGATPELRRVRKIHSANPANPKGLTDREVEVLRHVASGSTNKEIADRLSLSVKTIDRHVSNIFTKLNVSNRSTATAFAHKTGLI